MSKWEEIDDKEKTRLILQHVMGCFILNTPEHPRGLEAATLGFHWPIAFWDDGIERWMTRDIATDPTIFDPLHSMDAAWLVVEEMKKRESFDNCEIVYLKMTRQRNIESIKVNFCFRNTVNAGRYPYKHYFAEFGTPQEAICLAALKVEGVEIEQEGI